VNFTESQKIINCDLPEYLKELVNQSLSNSYLVDSNFLSKALYYYSINDFDNALCILQKNLLLTSADLAIPQLIQKTIGLNLLGQIFLDCNCINEAKKILNELELIKHACIKTPNHPYPLKIFELIKYSEKEIEKEKNLCKQELNFVTKEIYEIAREALNMQVGEVAHHAIQAGTHAFKSLDHFLEVKKMEKETRSGEGGGESGCFDGTTIPMDRY
jgi:tetratricopeptide (TPR) repeat protein